MLPSQQTGTEHLLCAGPMQGPGHRAEGSFVIHSPLKHHLASIQCAPIVYRGLEKRKGGSLPPGPLWPVFAAWSGGAPGRQRTHPAGCGSCPLTITFLLLDAPATPNCLQFTYTHPVPFFFCLSDFALLPLCLCCPPELVNTFLSSVKTECREHLPPRSFPEFPQHGLGLSFLRFHNPLGSSIVLMMLFLNVFVPLLICGLFEGRGCCWLIYLQHLA